MNKIDVNSYLGYWPFKKLEDLGIDNYQRIAKEHGITKTLVSHFQSIFYNDFVDGEKELFELTHNHDNLEHIMTLNPEIPNYMNTFFELKEKFNVKAVKIFPNYHSFDLNAIDELLNLDIPLMITLRNMDIRCTYLLNEKPVDIEIIKSVISKAKNKIVLLQPLVAELSSLKDSLTENVFIDTCGLRHAPFPLEKALEFVSPKNILFGTGFPNNCIKNSEMLIDTADVSNEIKELIYYKNAKDLFHI